MKHIVIDMEHGGKREGSGRKKIEHKKEFRNATVSGTPEEIEKLKKEAEKSGKSFSRFVIEKCLND